MQKLTPLARFSRPPASFQMSKSKPFLRQMYSAAGLLHFQFDYNTNSRLRRREGESLECLYAFVRNTNRQVRQINGPVNKIRRLFFNYTEISKNYSSKHVALDFRGRRVVHVARRSANKGNMGSCQSFSTRVIFLD